MNYFKFPKVSEVHEPEFDYLNKIKAKKSLCTITKQGDMDSCLAPYTRRLSKQNKTLGTTWTQQIYIILVDLRFSFFLLTLSLFSLDN